VIKMEGDILGDEDGQTRWKWLEEVEVIGEDRNGWSR
jgi:hypothetical protein